MKLRQMITTAAFVAAAAAVLAQATRTSGIDLTLGDRAVRPQDDFYRYVNGAWLMKTEIPADRSMTSSATSINDKTESDLRSLVEGLAARTNKPTASTAQQIGDFYQAFMDEPAIERNGWTPIANLLREIEAIKTAKDMAAWLGAQSLAGLPGPVNDSVGADASNPTQYALYVTQSGLALPDRDYYLLDDARFVDVRAKYATYLEKVFTLVGRRTAAADAKAVLALETELARLQWSNVENRDALKTFNKMPVASLATAFPGFDWLAWGSAQHVDTAREWVVAQPSYFRGFAALVPTTPLATWKAWMTAQVITLHAELLSQPFANAHFELFGTTLAGQQKPRERWSRGVRLLNDVIGEAVGQQYVDRFFPPANKARVQVIIRNLLEAYRQSISGLDWMTPATRQSALAKLAKLRTKIGYPDRFRDYRALRVSRTDLVGSVRRAREFEAAYQISKLSKPVDHNDWVIPPQTVNAYYNPSENEIVFPAAILQAPIFDVSADDASNYGAIGSVVGHEIGHAFDDQGRRFDGDGRLRDWWTATDDAEFKKRAEMLVQQFNAYSPLPGLHINGALTVGENIGDLGGVSIAYRAWKISLGGAASPTIDGLTGDERFFMGYAQAFRGKARDAYLQRQVLADPHAWNEFRAIGPLSNMQAFYDAFNVKPGDRMYRAEKDRVKIW